MLHSRLGDAQFTGDVPLSKATSRQCDHRQSTSLALGWLEQIHNKMPCENTSQPLQCCNGR
jgi:Tfp pilus assembly protein PilV